MEASSEKKCNRKRLDAKPAAELPTKHGSEKQQHNLSPTAIEPTPSTSKQSTSNSFKPTPFWTPSCAVRSECVVPRDDCISIEPVPVASCCFTLFLARRSHQKQEPHRCVGGIAEPTLHPAPPPRILGPQKPRQKKKQKTEDPGHRPPFLWISQRPTGGRPSGRQAKANASASIPMLNNERPCFVGWAWCAGSTTKPWLRSLEDTNGATF